MPYFEPQGSPFTVLAGAILPQWQACIQPHHDSFFDSALPVSPRNVSKSIFIIQEYVSAEALTVSAAGPSGAGLWAIR